MFDALQQAYGWVQRTLTQALQWVEGNPLLLLIIVIFVAGAWFLILRGQGKTGGVTPRVGGAVRGAVVLTLGAGGAWALASWLGSGSAVFAAMGALVVGSVRVGGSLKTSWGVLAATLGGLVVAEVSVTAFESGTVAILVTLCAGILLGQVMGLGLEGGAATAVTGVFAAAMGPGLTQAAAADRILATAAGAVIGLTISYLINFRSPAALASRELDTLSSAVAAVLVKVGAGEDEAGALLESREVLLKVQNARPAIEDAAAHSRLGGKAMRETAVSLEERYQAIAYAAESANTIARSYHDAAAAGTGLPDILGEAVAATGEAWAADGDDLQGIFADAKRKTKEARLELRSLDSTQEMIISASVLEDLRRMTQPVALGDIPDPRIRKERRRRVRSEEDSES